MYITIQLNCTVPTANTYMQLRQQRVCVCGGGGGGGLGGGEGDRGFKRKNNITSILNFASVIHIVCEENDYFLFVFSFLTAHVFLR